MTPTYHERVAAVMAASQSVGTHHSYEAILAHLRKKFTEAQLRALVESFEAKAHAVDGKPDWRFLGSSYH